MAEDQDDGQKTEEPTQRRLDEARGKGQVATSREVNHALMLGAGALLVGLLAPKVAGDLAVDLRRLLERPHEMAFTVGELDRALAALLVDVGAALLLAALLMVGAALASGLIQNGLILSAEVLTPKLERMSPLAGAKRLFSLRSLIEFGKGVTKIALVSAVGIALLWPAGPRILTAAELDAGAMLGLRATSRSGCWPASPCWSG